MQCFTYQLECNVTFIKLYRKGFWSWSCRRYFVPKCISLCQNHWDCIDISLDILNICITNGCEKPITIIEKKRLITNYKQFYGCSVWERHLAKGVAGRSVKNHWGVTIALVVNVCFKEFLKWRLLFYSQASTTNGSNGTNGEWSRWQGSINAERRNR